MEVLSYRVRFGSSLRSVGECSPEHAQRPPLTVGGGVRDEEKAYFCTNCNVHWNSSVKQGIEC